MAVDAHAVPVALGLLPSEIVLRGGGLKKPTVLTDIEVVDSRPFFRLRKSDPVLSAFLGAGAPCRRAMAKTNVVEALCEARCHQQAQLNKALLEGNEGAEAQGGPAVQPQFDDLDLDGPPSPGKPSPKRSKKKQALVRQLPRTLVLEMEMPDGQPWRPVVLLEAANKAPCIEATAANFHALFHWSSTNFDVGGVRRAPYGHQRGDHDSKRPKVYSDGSKEYWINGRWKRIWKDGSNNVVRTLKRRATGDDASAASGSRASQVLVLDDSRRRPVPVGNGQEDSLNLDI
jgi:hypothetical protein